MADEVVTLAPEHWLNSHEELKSDPGAIKMFSKFADETAAHKAHVQLEKKFGKAVRLPENLESLNDQERTEFTASIRKLQGVPETPEGYKVKRPEKMPEGLPYNENLEKAACQVAHKFNVPPDAFAGFVEAWNTQQITDFQTKKTQAETRANDALSKMKVELGTEYKPTLELVRRLLTHPKYVGSDEDIQALDDLLRQEEIDGQSDKTLGNRLPLIRFLINISRDLLGTGNTIPGEDFKRQTEAVKLEKEYPLSHGFIAGG